MTPLTGALPLRTTAVWDAYREAQPIPHRYGETAGVLLQYSADRRTFVWADHAVAGIDTVLVSGQQVSNWQHRNGTDSTGHAVALVEFDGPVDEGAELIARGRGKTANGRLMTNPADVVLDILNTLAERGVPAARLDDFRAACQITGLELGGSIEAADTVRAVITGLCNSIGAVWADDARGLCHLWPVAELVGYHGHAARTNRLRRQRRRRRPGQRHHPALPVRRRDRPAPPCNWTRPIGYCATGAAPASSMRRGLRHRASPPMSPPACCSSTPGRSGP
jgi:hypothetical protein